VHLGAAHHTANVVLLDGDVLAPGHTGRVQLVLDAPVHAVPGDRFVIRNAQATATIGGGMVLDPFGPARKRRSDARLAWLRALSDYIASGDIAALLARSPLGLRMSTLVRLSQLPADQIALAGRHHRRVAARRRHAADRGRRSARAGSAHPRRGSTNSTRARRMKPARNCGA
jgi:selenocysteine-specific elongation factor